MAMTLCNDVIPLIDVSTRSKRRRATSFVLNLLGRMHSAEWDNLERFPHNLRHGAAYAKADYSLDALAEAVAVLWDAY